jgi:hypothetical protein
MPSQTVVSDGVERALEGLDAGRRAGWAKYYAEKERAEVAEALIYRLMLMVDDTLGSRWSWRGPGESEFTPLRQSPAIVDEVVQGLRALRRSRPDLMGGGDKATADFDDVISRMELEIKRRQGMQQLLTQCSECGQIREDCFCEEGFSAGSRR